MLQNVLAFESCKFLEPAPRLWSWYGRTLAPSLYAVRSVRGLSFACVDETKRLLTSNTFLSYLLCLAVYDRLSHYKTWL